MALSLSAEQKSINDLFERSERLIIPDFQRAYSWDYATCLQMYTDLTQAFERGEEYFLGNILLARSKDEPKQPRVIDGQQRLITLWLILKSLSILLPHYEALPGLLCVSLSLRNKDLVSKIASMIPEVQDQQSINEVWEMDKSQLEKYRNHVNKEKRRVDGLGDDMHVLSNVTYLYTWFSEFAERSIDDLDAFCDYLLEHVYLLPIEIGGESIEDSTSRTLTIFETLNNRGLDLTDADIFKSRLYAKAKNNNKEKDFIEKWVDLNDDCCTLRITVDDVFRYYSHILRGREGISTSEIKLRDFFVLSTNAPLVVKPVDEVMADLQKIVGVIKYIDASRKMEDEGAVWMQVLDMYTNVFPFYALVVFLFVNGTDNRSKFVSFLKSLVRYSYSYGSSSSIKFGVYNIIKQISFSKNYYFSIDTKPESLNYTGRLQKGFALLLYYLNNPHYVLKSFYITKRLRKSENIHLRIGWEDSDVEKIDASISNMRVCGKFVDRFEDSACKGGYSDVMCADDFHSYAEFCNIDEKNKQKIVSFFNDLCE